MPQRIMGLDVGAWSVKGVLVEDRLRGFRVVRVNEIRVPSDERPLAERQAEALEALRAAEPEKVDAYVAAVGGERAAVRWLELPYSDAKKIDQTIGGELADVLPFDLDDAVHAHSLLTKRADGGSLSLAVAARTDDVRDTLALLQGADTDPKYLGVDVLALWNLYTHYIKTDGSKPEEASSPAPDAGTLIIGDPDGPPEARLVVDIGHERTLVAACGETGVAYTRVLRAGGADVSRAIGKVADDPAEAEAIKHEDGFVASSRHPAPDERTQQISDAVSAGLEPLVRELRRSLLSIRRERRVRIARIDLLGGGSRIRNLASYLAEQLNVPTAQGTVVEQVIEREVEPARRAAFALALSSTLRLVGEEPTNPIDLRIGDLAFAGQLQHMRSRIPAMAIGLAIVFVLLGVNVWANIRTTSAREAAIDAQFCKITKEAIGREICDAKRAISAMQNPTGPLGSVAMPERSALNIAAELSARIPKDLDVKVREMQIQPKRAKIAGEAPSFDAVDQIVTEYAKDSCYTEIKKGKLRRLASSDRIEFVLSMDLECT